MPNLAALWLAVIGFGIAAIVGAVVSKILAQISANENNTAVTEIVNYGQEAVKTLVSWLPTLAIAIAGVIIIVLIARAFGGLGRRGE